MHKKYKSKIGYFFPISLLIIFAFLFKFTYFNDGKLFGPIILICMIAFITPIFFRTYYLITDDNKLKIISGFFYNKTFEIVDILRISESKGDGANAPALSMERIELKFLDNKTVLISPENKEDFIENMILINSNIELKGFD